jgi:hypothetical protein
MLGISFEIYDNAFNYRPDARKELPIFSVNCLNGWIALLPRRDGFR